MNEVCLHCNCEIIGDGDFCDDLCRREYEEDLVLNEQSYKELLEKAQQEIERLRLELLIAREVFSSTGESHNKNIITDLMLMFSLEPGTQGRIVGLVENQAAQINQLRGALDFYAKHHHHLNTTAPNYAREALSQVTEGELKQPRGEG